jgi:FixJ family two-component response regulator
MTEAKPFVAVVDDDESVRRAIRRLLRSVGVASETFKAGEEFLDAFAAPAGAAPSQRPGCIVLDVQMPGISGLEVQRRLAGSRIPLIFITAHDEPGVREQALAAGAAAYITKPFNDATLIDAVSAAIGVTP